MVKRQFYATAGALFNLNAHGGTVFSLSGETDVH
jgi:hypothetical protein